MAGGARIPGPSAGEGSRRTDPERPETSDYWPRETRFESSSFATEAVRVFAWNMR